MSAEPISELFYSILHKRISSVYTSAFATRMHSRRCVLPAALAVSWGVSASVHAGIHPPGVGLETPLGVGLENPPGLGLENPPRCGPGDPTRCGPGDPPGCGPGDPPGVGLETPLETPQAPPWVWAWKPARHARIHPLGDLQGMLGYHPPPPVDIQTRVKS